MQDKENHSDKTYVEGTEQSPSMLSATTVSGKQNLFGMVCLGVHKFLNVYSGGTGRLLI